MKKYFLASIFFLFLFIKIFPDDSQFDKYKYKYDFSKNYIDLYVAEFEDCNSYKAVTTFKTDRKVMDFINVLLDFKMYSKLFPKTLVFKSVKTLSENSFYIYAVVDLFPFKKRDYIIELKYFKTGADNIIEWYSPVEDFCYNELEKSKNYHIKNVSGRWVLREVSNGEIYLSFETRSNFEINAIKSLVTKIEKTSTIGNIESLFKYMSIN